MIQVVVKDCRGREIAYIHSSDVVDALKVIRPDLVMETTNIAIDALNIIYDELHDLRQSVIRSRDMSLVFEIRRAL